jgi:hypothetical protein
MAVGVALDVISRWVVQIFRHVNTGRLLLLPLEGGKCDTSRLPITPTATLAAIEKRTEQHVTNK